MSTDHRHSLLYVAVGDSLTAGIGTLLKPGFVQLYKQKAERALKRKIQVQVFAKNGASSEDILHMLSRPHLQQAVRKAHLITLSAGGNDLRQAAKPFFNLPPTEVSHF
ncbi:hypothetical protein GCM10010965_31690 [Caldalkalibacillus thermarum]|uniref:GDSL-type esterase/lipase family protein n=1 Tax=Caldalkalibacillus thermarum TaxID=296745 RepID=UPI00166A73AA|nr:GDSL-type esterase/lipase family protein [Caldalkalibacillus thermarum]GGK36423.1 hypothetical protein GCM10010965_31690 [Caldalkalibacillus thermarum]